jgi:hypothetical protein
VPSGVEERGKLKPVIDKLVATPELEGGAAPLIADLGLPATRLDGDYGTLPIAQGEWPYPLRGVTLFLNTTSDKVLHLALYQPTTLEV